MFRIYYYIFGLDGIPRYVSINNRLFSGLKLSKEKTSFLSFGWTYSTINCEDFSECVKMDAKDIYKTYQCPAYVYVENDNSVILGPMTEDDYKAIRLSNHFDKIFRDEYQNWLKSARQ